MLIARTLVGSQQNANARTFRDQCPQVDNDRRQSCRYKKVHGRLCSICQLLTITSMEQWNSHVGNEEIYQFRWYVVMDRVNYLQTFYKIALLVIKYLPRITILDQCLLVIRI